MRCLYRCPSVVINKLVWFCVFCFVLDRIVLCIIVFPLFPVLPAVQNKIVLEVVTFIYSIHIRFLYHVLVVVFTH
jgi:hypothetical protein